MEPALLGIVLDSSVVIDAERAGLTVQELLERINDKFGEVEVSLSAVTVAEIVHGVARASTADIRTRRRGFIDELKRHVPTHPVTDESGEIAGMISGEQASKGMVIPIDDLLIGVAALEQGYAVATRNARHFELIPGVRIVTP
jgi:predicted nucleic acid-binding protein